MIKVALLVIDMQKEYEPDGKLPVNHLSRVKQNVKELIDTARANSNLLIHIRHISPDLNSSDFVAGTNGVKFMDGFAPRDGEIAITKNFVNSFSAPELEKTLRKNDIEDVIVCGLTSILCCDTTCRIGQEKGFRMKYVTDAISEFDLSDRILGDSAHAYVDAVQAAMFSEVLTTEQAVKLIRSDND